MYISYLRTVDDLLVVLHQLQYIRVTYSYIFYIWREIVFVSVLQHFIVPGNLSGLAILLSIIKINCSCTSTGNSLGYSYQVVNSVNAINMMRYIFMELFDMCM